MMVPKPAAGEFAEFYAGYVASVESYPDLLSVLLDQARRIERLLLDAGEENASYRYAEGKWSIREVVAHLLDAERVFAYRTLCIARGDQTPLPGFDEGDYVREGHFERRTLTSVVAEWRSVRDATIRLIENIPGEAWERSGSANGTPLSARAAAWITAGHTEHHLTVLRDRYGITRQT